MATKGASNRYGNTKGSNRQDKPSEEINYAWAKDFNKKSLAKHYSDHGKDIGLDNQESYRQHAIRFANTIDKKNNISFVDSSTNSTYKYNKSTNEFVIITKDGYVVTYFKHKEGYSYYNNQILKHGKRGNKK